VSETVQIEGGTHLKINARKKNDDDSHHVDIKHTEQTYMSTSRNIHKSLTQLKRLSGLVDTDEPKSSFELDPWMENPDVTYVKRLQKKSENARNSTLKEYRNALSAFKSTHKTQALAEYTDLKRRFPSHSEYVQILKKLRAIFKLPKQLKSFIQQPTIDNAKNINKKCTSILRMHEQRDYDPLFKTYAYLDLQGREKIPKYGKWTYNKKEYEMQEMIQDIQDKISFFIIKLSQQLLHSGTPLAPPQGSHVLPQPLTYARAQDVSPSVASGPHLEGDTYFVAAE
jgi:hypothetical protein